MATITIPITGGTATSVSIVALSPLPTGVSLPIAATNSGGTWTATFNETAFVATYAGTAQITLTDSTVVNVPVDAQGAFVTGQIVTSATITSFLASENLIILSQQDPSQTNTGTPNYANVQTAINEAESHVIGKLRNYFQYPLNVAGVPLISATSSLSYQQLQGPTCRLAAHWLNEWRLVQSAITETPHPVGINSIAKGWKLKAESDVAQMIRWADGYTDGMSTDLALQPWAPVNFTSQGQAIQAPVIAQAPRNRGGWGYGYGCGYGGGWW